MLKRRKIKRKSSKWKLKFTQATPAPLPAAEKLSDIWYTYKEGLKKLDMSPTTAWRRRQNGSLIVSKQFGKLQFNDYHIQQYLRGGLSKVVTGFALLAHILDGVGELVMAM